MTDENYICDVCGFESESAAGLASHERTHDSDDSSDFEEAVLERDDETCQKCGETEEVGVHRLKEGEDSLAYAVTLCPDCEDEVTGLNHRTKRTLIDG